MQCNVCIHMEIKVGNTLRKQSWSFIRMETIDNFDNWYPSWIQIMEVLEGEDRSRAEECGVPWLLIDDVSQVWFLLPSLVTLRWLWWYWWWCEVSQDQDYKDSSRIIYTASEDKKEKPGVPECQYLCPSRLQSPDSGITFLVSDVVVLGDKGQYQSQSSEKISIRILQPDFL